MNQAKPSRPVPPMPVSVQADAKARAFATPSEPGFAQALDSLPPGPLLVAVVERGVKDLSRFSRAELAALARASERLIIYYRCLEFVIISELVQRGLPIPVDLA